MALAILFAGIIVTIFPAMSEVNQPDASAKEQQVEDGNQSGVEEVDKKKGHHRHGDMRRKGRQMLNKGGFGVIGQMRVTGETITESIQVEDDECHKIGDLEIVEALTWQRVNLADCCHLN